MQTFMPLPDFDQSAQCLDYKRLGKQRVEALQIINTIEKTSSLGWKNHPAVKMWIGYTPALKTYCNAMIHEWIKRGYNNSMKMYQQTEPIIMPAWVGDERFHASHRSNLLRKDFLFYGKFGWQEGPELEYFWPTYVQPTPSMPYLTSQP